MSIPWVAAARSAWTVAQSPVEHIQRQPLTAVAVATGLGVLLGSRGRSPLRTAIELGLLAGVHRLADSPRPLDRQVPRAPDSDHARGAASQGQEEGQGQVLQKAKRQAV